jgi:hypothetical protein
MDLDFIQNDLCFGKGSQSDEIIFVVLSSKVQ